MQTNIEAEKKKIDREYARLGKCFLDFAHLKKSIADLVNNAATDPAAEKRLVQLQSLFPGGLGEIENNARQDMKTLSIALKKLQSKLKDVV